MNKLLISLLVSLGITGFAHAEGDAAAGQAKAAVCFGCHGPDGNSAAPNFPKLAGQNASYIVKQLKDFKAGETRQSQTMAGFVAALDEQAMADIAAYFASQSVSKGPGAGAEVMGAGEQIYRAGIAEQGVAACTACHGPTGEGNAQAGFPALEGQHAAYIESQLKKFRKGAEYSPEEAGETVRANDPNGMMRDVAAKLSDREIANVSAYIQAME